MTLNLVYTFCASMVRAAGDTQTPLLILSVAGVLNVILNIVFVKGCGMNVDLWPEQPLSPRACLLLPLFMWDDQTNRYGPAAPEKVRVYKEEPTEDAAHRHSGGIQSSMFSASNVVIQSAVNSFGAVIAVSAMQPL